MSETTQIKGLDMAWLKSLSVSDLEQLSALAKKMMYQQKRDATALALLPGFAKNVAKASKNLHKKPKLNGAGEPAKVEFMFDHFTPVALKTLKALPQTAGVIEQLERELGVFIHLSATTSKTYSMGHDAGNEPDTKVTVSLVRLHPGEAPTAEGIVAAALGRT